MLSFCLVLAAATNRRLYNALQKAGFVSVNIVMRTFFVVFNKRQTDLNLARLLKANLFVKIMGTIEIIHDLYKVTQKSLYIGEFRFYA